MNNTTDLKLIKFGKGSNFTWGEAILKHEIEEYSIVEYHPYIYKNGCGTSEINYNNTEYLCYVNGRDIRIEADSLDSAIANCIAYKHDGANSQAAKFFIKMIS